MVCKYFCILCLFWLDGIFIIKFKENSRKRDFLKSVFTAWIDFAVYYFSEEVIHRTNTSPRITGTYLFLSQWCMTCRWLAPSGSKQRSPLITHHRRGSLRQGLKPMIDVVSFMGRKNPFLRRRRLRNRFVRSSHWSETCLNHFRRPMLHLKSFMGTASESHGKSPCCLRKHRPIVINLQVPGIPPNINGGWNMHSSCSFLPVICPLFEGFK